MPIIAFLQRAGRAWKVWQQTERDVQTARQQYAHGLELSSTLLRRELLKFTAAVALPAAICLFALAEDDMIQSDDDV